MQGTVYVQITWRGVYKWEVESEIKIKRRTFMADTVMPNTGDCLNIKMSSNQYSYPHVKDKTVSRPSYL